MNNSNGVGGIYSNKVLGYMLILHTIEICKTSLLVIVLHIC